MKLDPSKEYVYRIGSDNQYRLHWNGTVWCYEFLAGSVIFDEQRFKTEDELADALFMHGLTFDKFHIDSSNDSAEYSGQIRKKMEQLTALGIRPCPKHGLSSKNLDGSCEACANQDYPDDFKGQEG
jgi:hypothetical protein